MSIQNFNRTDDLFSLCGLNCGLCGYRLQGNCNGCFKDRFSSLRKHHSYSMNAVFLSKFDPSAIPIDDIVDDIFPYTVLILILFPCFFTFFAKRALSAAVFNDEDPFLFSLFCRDMDPSFFFRKKLARLNRIVEKIRKQANHFRPENGLRNAPSSHPVRFTSGA